VIEEYVVFAVMIACFCVGALAALAGVILGAKFKWRFEGNTESLFEEKTPPSTENEVENTI